MKLLKILGGRRPYPALSPTRTALASLLNQARVSVLLEALQDWLMSRLLEEAQQVVRSEPHGGSVGHRVEVDHLVASFHQVPVQDELHAAILIEEQSKSRRTALTHLKERGGGV